MKVLQELSPLSDKKAIFRQLYDKKGDSLVRKLLELIEDPGLTDDAAAKALYGPSSSRKLSAYKALKSRLRQLMVNSIHNARSVKLGYSTYNAAYESGYRQMYTINLLLANRAYNAAREVASSTFKNVRKYEIIPLNQALTNQMTYMYLGVAYNERLYRKYSKLNQYYSKAAYELSRLEHRYREVRNMIYAHELSYLEIGRITMEYLSEFVEARSLYPKASQLQGLIFMLEINGLMFSGRYQEAIESSRQGEAVLNSCVGASSSVMNFLLLSRLESILKAEDFELGRSEIENAARKLPENSINGIKVVEYAIRLGLQMEQYDYAYLAFANMNRRLIKRLLTAQHQQYWMIWEAFINFLVVAGKINPEPDWPELPRFKFTKFFNNVPKYSRNKTGMNIPILILQAIYFIVEKKYDRVIDRTEALERYCGRYLKNDENLRNNCFFKLLLTTVQANFHKRATERKAAPILRRMAYGVTKTDATNDTEIIPYEQLWAIVLDHLDTSRRVEATMR